MSNYPDPLMLQVKQRQDRLLAEANQHRLLNLAREWRRACRARQTAATVAESREARAAQAQAAQARAAQARAAVVVHPALVHPALAQAVAAQAVAAQAAMSHPAGRSDSGDAGTLATCGPHVAGSVR